MRMQWFGPGRDIDLAATLEHVKPPIGQPCAYCGEAIGYLESGVMMAHVGAGGHISMEPWHIECEMRSIVGGVNHQNGTCRCCGGTEDPDPPDLTRRQAAIAAALHFWNSER